MRKSSRVIRFYFQTVFCVPSVVKKIDVNKGEGYMSYWRWRLFYEKKCSE